MQELLKCQVIPAIALIDLQALQQIRPLLTF